MKEKPHPMSKIKINESVLLVHEYLQLCAQSLLNTGFMSRVDHKKFIKKIRIWMDKNKVSYDHVMTTELSDIGGKG